MKNYLYRGLLYGWHNFRSWVVDLRTICVFLCVMIFLYENILGVATFANSYNLGFTPWLLPFMATTRIVDLVLWLALLLLLCDLGVEKRFDIYVQLRLPVWALRIGRLFAAFLRVSFFWAVVSASPIFLFFRYIEWNSHWGKVIGTLARDIPENLLGTYSIRFSSMIVNRYSPTFATLICFFLSILEGWILGIIILIGNDIYKKIFLGSSIAGFFVLLDFWVRTDPLACSRWLRFSFITFHNLRCISSIPKIGYITLAWAVGFCIISALALAAFYIFQKFFSGVKYASDKKFMQVIWENTSP